MRECLIRSTRTVVLAQHVQRVFDQVPALDRDEDRDSSVDLGPAYVARRPGRHHLPVMTAGRFVDAPDLLPGGFDSPACFDGSRCPNGEKGRVHAAFAQAGDVDVPGFVSRGKIPLGFGQALRRVAVRVDDDRTLMQRSRPGEIFILDRIHGAGLYQTCLS